MRIIGGKTPLKSDTWPPDKKVVLTQKCWQCDTCLVSDPAPAQTDKIWFISTELDLAGVWVRRENFNFKCFLIRLGLTCNGLLPQYVPNTSSPPSSLWELRIAGSDWGEIAGNGFLFGWTWCDVITELDIKIKITQPTQSVMLWGYADCNGLTPRVGIITARPGQARQWTPNLLMIPQYWWFRLVFVSVSATHCSHLIIILVSVRSSRSQLCFSINWQDRDWSATLQSRIKTDWLTDH